MRYRKYLKVALPTLEYTQLCARADAHGMTLSAFVRSVLASDQQTLDIGTVLSRIDRQLARVVGTTTEKSVDPEPLLVEIILLARELVADRNAQLLMKVNQQLDVRYPQRRKTL